RSVSRASLSLVAEGSGLPPAPGALYVDVEAVNNSGAEDAMRRGPGEGSVAEAIARRGLPLDSLTLSVDPRPEEIAAALERGRGRDIVVGVYSASGHPTQLELVRALARQAAATGTKLGLVSMRSPYDAAPLLAAAAPLAPAVLCAYEYTALSAGSVADHLSGTVRAGGRCPVAALPGDVIHNVSRRS
ncbi:MAG: hypothetical protein JNG85_06760, partial [Spirochaetaceae bacterium]|nr:hypothetical protein [Spirochaetaceae bacterium]